MVVARRSRGGQLLKVRVRRDDEIAHLPTGRRELLLRKDWPRHSLLCCVLAVLCAHGPWRHASSRRWEWPRRLACAAETSASGERALPLLPGAPRRGGVPIHIQRLASPKAVDVSSVLETYLAAGLANSVNFCHTAIWALENSVYGDRLHKDRQ